METEDYGDLASLRKTLANLRSAREELWRLRRDATWRSDAAFNSGVEDESSDVHGTKVDYDRGWDNLNKAIFSVQALIASEQFRLDPNLQIATFE
jgi:hypothetical protein